MTRYFWEEDMRSGYKPAEQAVAHIVVARANAETPGGTDTEEQLAACGQLNCGYSMSPIIINSGLLEEARKLRVPICPRCSAVMKKFRYALDGSDYKILFSVESNVGLLGENAESYIEPACSG